MFISIVAKVSLREVIYLENVWALMHKKPEMRELLVYIGQD